jgi:glycosyltransferase involved in cell wall biosynthesis
MSILEILIALLKARQQNQISRMLNFGTANFMELYDLETNVYHQKINSIKDTPKYSVVTISYNQADFLEETILSVLEQKKSNDVEYIVMDGGSTDGSIEIIKRYASDIDFWVSEKDKGPGDALNKGFAKATGDFILYLNSDDVFLPGAFDHLTRSIQDFPGADVYYGHGYMQFDHCKERIPIFSDKWGLLGYVNKTISIVQQSTAISRKSFDQTQGFNLSNYDNWDGELLVDLALVGAKFQRIEHLIGVFRMYPGSISGANANVERYKATQKRIHEKASLQYYLPLLPSKLAKLITTIKDMGVARNRLKNKKRIDQLKQEMVEL